MPQSHAQMLCHLIFSTKHREPLLLPGIRAELHPYLAVTLTENECPSIQVGGVEDHVHLFFLLSRTRTIASIVEAVKTSSSKWLKTKSPELRSFAWQHGYGAFSCAQSQVEQVVRYIRNQEEHHRKMTFQEEYRAFLEKYQIKFDERYVWD